MSDPDATVPVPKVTPPAEEPSPEGTKTIGLTHSKAERFLGDAIAGSTTRSSNQRVWQPPGVEDLQRALPQYDISAFLARGGMGAVYKGVQKSLRRTVAIKVLPPDMEDGDMQFAERFKHEAQAMAHLSHPNIVAVFDAGETADGLLYFVMEFIKGTDVADLIAKQGQLPPEQATAITAHVCDALAFAHESGIIHRDIKPSNIMLDTRGRVKVADFGLAKMASLEGGGLTRSNVAMGTPDFVAPEALIAGIPIDQRADLYAVGVMLYQMLTGKGMTPLVDAVFGSVSCSTRCSLARSRVGASSCPRRSCRRWTGALMPSWSGPCNRTGRSATPPRWRCAMIWRASPRHPQD